MREKNFLNRLGLLGVVSFISYLSAVAFAPLAYPGYDWKSQAVSDLCAVNAPSLGLWNRLSCLYGICGLLCIMAVCVYIEGKLSGSLRIGIYLFAAMQWVSCVGYSLFPLSETGGGKALSDIIHVYAVTPAVVLLSIISLVILIIGGFQKKRAAPLAVTAVAALALMLTGAIGVNAAPPQYFGIFERLSSVLSANGFNMALGLFLYGGKF